MLEWSLKVAHLDYVKEISKGKDFKTVLLYTGGFLEIVFQVCSFCQNFGIRGLI